MADSAVIHTSVAGPYRIVEGETRRFSATFRTMLGVAVDPAVVVVRFRDPDAAVATVTKPAAELTSPSVGRWEIDKPLVLPGVWTVRWEVSGDVQGASEMRVTVQDSEVV